MKGWRKTQPRSRRASSVARLSLAYAVVFILISGLFFAGAMHLVAQKNRERLQSLVFADSRDLKTKIDEAPLALRLDIARAIVGARIAQGKDRVQYALVAPSEDWFGNLSASSIRVARDGQLVLATHGWLSVAAIDRIDLGQGAYILLGRSQDEAGLERDVMAVGALALALAGLVAFVIGPIASLRLVRRVEAVNQACENFGAGDLTARAPGAAASDEFGALARSVNAMFERIDALVGGLREVSNQAAHDLRTRPSHACAPTSTQSEPPPPSTRRARRPRPRPPRRTPYWRRSTRCSTSRRSRRDRPSSCRRSIYRPSRNRRPTSIDPSPRTPGSRSRWISSQPMSPASRPC